MNMDWFRSWHGAPTDPKWLLIAKRSETFPGVVSAIVWALLDYASQNSADRGNVEGFDAETYAAFSGFEEATVHRVIDALKEKKLIDDGHLTNWKKRQSATGNVSTPRVQKHRNAMKRTETPRNAREDKTRSEKKDVVAESRAREPLPDDDWPKDFREQFWHRYPHKVGKPKALTKLEGIRKRGVLVPFEALMAGLDRYIRDKPPDRQWLNPETFLNNDRWADQPAIITASFGASDVQPGSDQPSRRPVRSAPSRGGGLASILADMESG